MPIPMATPANAVDPHACFPLGKQLPQLPGQANAFLVIFSVLVLVCVCWFMY
jgi:hypothetical protein